jgi:hypothetical protein
MIKSWVAPLSKLGGLMLSTTPLSFIASPFAPLPSTLNASERLARGLPCIWGILPVSVSVTVASPVRPPGGIVSVAPLGWTTEPPCVALMSAETLFVLVPPGVPSAQAPKTRANATRASRRCLKTGAPKCDCVCGMCVRSLRAARFFRPTGDKPTRPERASHSRRESADGRSAAHCGHGGSRTDDRITMRWQLGQRI